ncbi:MAG: chemotaxis-specific protein-glutamate methyltransferase CheB [Xanthobacteraceae bacterium]
MALTRVLVVEDSATVRERLIRALADDRDIDIVGVAKDGSQGVELCRLHRPDAITMDMMMPVMSGLAATEYIMAHCPTPILIVSSSLNRGELFKIYDALSAGAVDVLEKPTGEELDGEWQRRLRSAVKLVAKIKVISHIRARLQARPRVCEILTPAPASQHAYRRRIVAIGASTGGPGAVSEVLRSLPRHFRIPVLVVVHMNATFASALTDWLNAQSELHVVPAQNGALVASLQGCVAVAPGDRHLIVRSGRIVLTDDAERQSCRPSVDVLFESVAAEYGADAVGCLLTGMGKDGALGLLRIRQAGGLTIAQDEASSVVYGMPREALALGAVACVSSLKDIGPRLAALPAGFAEVTQ